MAKSAVKVRKTNLYNEIHANNVPESVGVTPFLLLYVPKYPYIDKIVVLMVPKL